MDAVLKRLMEAERLAEERLREGERAAVDAMNASRARLAAAEKQHEDDLSRETAAVLNAAVADAENGRRAAVQAAEERIARRLASLAPAIPAAVRVVAAQLAHPVLEEPPSTGSAVAP